jgi:hypothetical protein
MQYKYKYKYKYKYNVSDPTVFKPKQYSSYTC